MEKGKINRDRRIIIRLNEEEYGLLYEKLRQTTCQQLSDYVRRVIFDKKVTLYTRNQSLDDMLQEILCLKRELNAIGSNFNQTVRKLHTLQDIEGLKIWLQVNEQSKKLITDKIQEIFLCLEKMWEQWSQE